ncbi:MAG: UDP-3-O-(3-hydroxymyristoyl)glucosamine N-acyltransferase [Bacteroidales bacterium]|nr:UDP-3-O-(3-hydroxymyristoyl)glucosamine N-acyltransferase [Bacteroidales bacterium]
MLITVSKLAELLNGRVEGDGNIVIKKIGKIDDGNEGEITFLANPLYTQFVYTTGASAIIVNENFKAEHSLSKTLIRVPDSYAAFAKLLNFYIKEQAEQIIRRGISEKAFISDTAKPGKENYIGEFSFLGCGVKTGNKVQIYPQVYIGDYSVIGDNTIIYPGVKIYSGIKIGSNCTIHSGVVIGGDGFGFAQQEGMDYLKVAQIGDVVIEDNVEIGANTTIDRATIGSTIIRKGVKLDNQIQIAHNVEIGDNTVIAAQSGISGSTKVGKNCMIGGQVGITGHLSIGDNVKIAAQSGIASDIKNDIIVQGSPAFEIKKYRKAYIHFRNLNEYVAQLNMLIKNEKK